jgi:cytochrome c peroxidase
MSTRSLVRFPALLAALAAVALAGRARSAGETGTPLALVIPERFEAPRIPAANPLTREKVALGERLFFERALSLDHTIACASCHDPRLGFSDGRASSKGIHGRTGTRNAPALLNVAYVPALFLDGRAGSLEEQALGPILNPSEMGLPDTAAIESRLAADASYRPLFEAAFADPRPTVEHAVQAIASFERTLVALSSPADRFFAGERDALSPEATRGAGIYRRRAGCASCHFAISQLPVWSEETFRSLGVGFTSTPFALASAIADRIEAAEKSSPAAAAAIKAERAASILGRYLVTGERKDVGRFRTPELRNVARTAPYMHDGSLPTLRAVVDFYDKGGEPTPTKHPQIRPLQLSEQEKSDLVAFMEALTADPSPNFDLRALQRKADAILGPLGPF